MRHDKDDVGIKKKEIDVQTEKRNRFTTGNTRGRRPRGASHLSLEKKIVVVEVHPKRARNFGRVSAFSAAFNNPALRLVSIQYQSGYSAYNPNCPYSHFILFREPERSK